MFSIDLGIIIDFAMLSYVVSVLVIVALTIIVSIGLEAVKLSVLIFLRTFIATPSEFVETVERRGQTGR